MANISCNILEIKHSQIENHNSRKIDYFGNIPFANIENNDTLSFYTIGISGMQLLIFAFVIVKIFPIMLYRTG